MSRTKPYYGFDRKISIAFTPLKHIQERSISHGVLGRLSRCIIVVRYRDILPGMDEQSKSQILRRLENTKLVIRVCRGIYTLTDFGRRALETLDNGHKWENPYYNQQMRELTNELKESEEFLEFRRQRRQGGAPNENSRYS